MVHPRKSPKLVAIPFLLGIGLIAAAALGGHAGVSVQAASPHTAGMAAAPPARSPHATKPSEAEEAAEATEPKASARPTHAPEAKETPEAMETHHANTGGTAADTNGNAENVESCKAARPAAPVGAAHSIGACVSKAAKSMAHGSSQGGGDSGGHAAS